MFSPRLSSNPPRNPPSISSAENHVDVAIHKDELQDSYEEFEKVFEANMRGSQKAKSLQAPVEPTLADKPELVDCGPKRVNIRRFQRDYVVSTSKSSAMRPTQPQHSTSLRFVGYKTTLL